MSPFGACTRCTRIARALREHGRAGGAKQGPRRPWRGALHLHAHALCRGVGSACKQVIHRLAHAGAQRLTAWVGLFLVVALATLIGWKGKR